MKLSVYSKKEVKEFIKKEVERRTKEFYKELTKLRNKVIDLDVIMEGILK